jgi:methylase of polypeptide subunit release factors
MSHAQDASSATAASTTDVTPLDATIVETLRHLRRLLDDHDYAGVAEAQGPVDLRTGPALAYKFRDASPLSVLLHLFLLGLDTSATTVDGVLTSAMQGGLLTAGILERTPDGQWRGTVQLFAYRGAIVCCDHARARAVPIEPVYSPGNDSTALVDASLDLEGGRALDLCTGSGIQAVVAGRHAQEVVAVDINPRAARFAAMSLALNAVHRATVRLGDLYDAVAGETFDLITANPPFVINQVRTQLYRDGGVDGGHVLRKILHGLPTHLNDGGFAQIVTLLHDFEGGSQLEETRDIASRHHLETLVLTSPPFDKYELAISQLQRRLIVYERYRSEVRDYLEHLESIKLQSCRWAVITCRNSGRDTFEAREGLRRVATFTLNLRAQLTRFYGLSPRPDDPRGGR